MYIPWLQSRLEQLLQLLSSFPLLTFYSRILSGYCCVTGYHFSQAHKTSKKKLMGVGSMLLSTDFASESDLLDRVIDQGIVIEAWDRVALLGIDMRGMRVTVSELQLFGEGKRLPFRAGYFAKVEPS